MAALKDDVLAALGKIPGPDGAPLPATGKLSDIVASDGKVFFSITVDAAAVKQWETVRARAEAAVRAVPGVNSVMVALTAERAGGAGGVGKSTTAVNLALGLRDLGLKAVSYTHLDVYKRQRQGEAQNRRRR